MRGAKQRGREQNNKHNNNSPDISSSHVSKCFSTHSAQPPDGKEVEITGSGEKSYAMAVSNEGKASCVFPRNLAPHLRQALYGGYKSQGQKAGTNERGRTMHDKGKNVLADAVR
jgi:hypothetical protein